MSKELETLEILYNCAKLDRDRIERGGIVTYAEEIEHNERIKPYYDTIKQALIKAQEQDFNYKEIVLPFFDELIKIYGITDTDEILNKIKEQEKVLKIIFEKTVNILLLELAENVDEYNERIVPNGKLTEEEFNLLKEYFK